LKIWILTSEFPDKAAGGIARYVENFSIIASKEGHFVTVFTKANENGEFFINENVKVIKIAPHSSFPYDILTFWDAFSFHMADRVIEHLRIEKPDIIEVQDYEAVGYYLIQRKLTQNILQNIPIVLHLHSPWFITAKYNQEPLFKLPYYWVGQMEKFCIVGADALIAPSNFIIDSVKRELKRDLKVEHFPLPTIIEDFQISENIKEKEIVYFGRLEVRKGVLKLLEKSKKLWDEGVDFTLVLIGSDTDYFPKSMSVGNYIKQNYKKYLGKKLFIKEAMDKKRLLERLSKAWAIVIPSLWENFPNTCIEAMSLGKVVLASSQGGQKEMIEDGVSGFIFSWDKKGDFEDKLKKILSLTKEEIKEISKKAQKRIMQISNPKEIVSKRIRHFEKVIENHSLKRYFPITYDYLREERNFKKYPQQKDLLSVIIPFYNMKEYIKESLEKIFESSYKNLEVIVVNDGSKKEDRDFLESLKNRFDFKIIHQENRGLSYSRNRGALEAKGEFIAFIDSDDLIERDFFEKSINVLKRYENVSFVYSWVKYFGAIEDIWPTYNAQFPYLLAHNMINANLVLRKDHFLNWGMNKEEMEYGLEDYESWISILEKGGVGVSLPEILVKYRIREDSMYRKISRDQILYLYEKIVSFHPEIYRKYATELFLLQNENASAYQFIHPSKSVFGDISWREYELGVKIVNFVKNNFLIRKILSNPKMKEFIKEKLKKLS